MARHAPDVARWAISRRCARVVKNRAVQELEIEVVQEINEGEIETVNIESVHLNKNWLLIRAKLEMQAGRNTIEILYKIDTGCEGNIMPLFMFKKLFKNTTEEPS